MYLSINIHLYFLLNNQITEMKDTIQTLSDRLKAVETEKATETGDKTLGVGHLYIYA